MTLGRRRVSFFLWLGQALLTCIGAQAYSPPSEMVSSTSGFVTQGLGSSCLAFDLPADILPCNPAFIAKERERKIKASIFFGNNVSYLKDANAIVSGQADNRTISRLFERQAPSELEASLDAGYLGETFGLQLTPFHLDYYSVFSNPALPDISLFAAIEESARIQFGSYLGENFYWGLQTRYVHRRFVASEFFLTDVLAENGRDLLQPREQNIFYLEPSLLYSPTDIAWSPEMSVSVMNLGMGEQSTAALAVVPQYHFTSSVTPPVGTGKLNLGLDLMLDRKQEDTARFATLGAVYQYGILKAFASLAQQSEGVGFIAADDFWSAGLAYGVRRFQDAVGDNINEHKVYLLLGAQL